MSKRRVSSALLLLVAPSWMVSQAPHADSTLECRRLNTKTSLDQLSGQRIGTLRLETDGPMLPVIGGVTGFAGKTKSSVVWKQLLFAAGDSIDTLRVAESLRRLRQERVFSDVELVATQCGASDVDLLLRTRDAWTLRPSARVLPPSTFLLGVEDRNLLGSGRSGSLAMSQTAERRGGSFTFGDPYIGGAPIAGDLRLVNLGSVYQLRSSVRSHESSVYDPWRTEVTFARTTREPTMNDPAEIRSLSGSALIGRRIHEHPGDGVVFLLMGAEFDSASSAPAGAADSNAFPPSARGFVGGDIGLSRRSAAFDTLSWFVPGGRSILDIPTGIEGDIVLGVGHEAVANRAAAHLDSWMGRMWLPQPGTIVVSDAWLSGFAGSGVPQNRVLRFALSAYQHAGWAGGYWGGRFMDENMSLTEADLRTRGLVTAAFDPTLAAVPLAARRASHATVASLERMFGLGRLETAAIDLGVFGSASYRADIRNDSLPYDRMRVAMVGTRIRVLTSTGTTFSTRIDLGYPVGTNAYVRRRPYFSITVGPLFDVGRRRDGVRIE